MARLAIGEVAAGGTAFAVGPELAITAAHAVGPTGGEVTVRLDGQSRAARVIDTDASLDLALLRFTAPLPAELRLLRLTDEVSPADAFRAPGYPYLPDLDRQLAALTVSGQITDVSVPLDEIEALQLTVTQAAARQPLSLHGLSGAPVLTGPDELVVGIIRWSPEQDGLAIGGLCFATPALAALRRWPAQLADVFIRPKLASLLRTPLLKGGELPAPDELDLASLGAATIPPGHADGQLPYVRRTGDAQLDAIFADPAQTCVLITGEPRAGKTRSALEAIRRNCALDKVVVPADWNSFEQLVARNARTPLAAGRLVWFLDEINRYLAVGSGPMTTVLTNVLDHLGSALLVTTVRSDLLATMLATEGGLEPQRAAALRLLQARSKGGYQVARLADAAELAAARLAYPGERFTAAIGIAERLGRADQVRARYQGDAPLPSQALVRAAVDWQRIGRGEPIPDQTLRDWYAAYVRADRPFAEVGAESFRQALDWATSPLYPGATRLALLQAVTGPPDASFTAEDYLTGVDDGRTGTPPRPIPDLAWDLGLQAATAADCLEVGYAALARGDWKPAARAIRHGTGPALLGTPWSVARWIVFGGAAEAIDRYLSSQQAAAAQGHWTGYYNLAMYATTEAEFTNCMEQAVQAAAQPADQAALLHQLGTARWYRDDAADALRWWLQAAQRGPGPHAADAALRAAAYLAGPERADLLAAAAAAGPGLGCRCRDLAAGRRR